jgi:hypothetical protein
MSTGSGIVSWTRLGRLAVGVASTVVAMAAALLIINLRSPSPTAAGGTEPTASTDPATSAQNQSPTDARQPTTSVAPERFTTKDPGAALPSGQQCAAWVRARAYPENKGANRRANQTTGHGVSAELFTGSDARAGAEIAPRIDGQFTGTTGQILRWAACKWGIDEALVMAQAAAESSWQQGTPGNWTSDSSRCAPGRGLGVDGRPGQCPESFGILQNRYPYEHVAWPGIARSTAMNADVAYAYWRACFEGYETWLNGAERGRDYAAGDAWGCVGRWFSRRWYTPASQGYIDRVRERLDQRVWKTSSFQQP